MANLSLDDDNIVPLYKYFDHILAAITKENADLEILVSSLMVLGNLARVGKRSFYFMSLPITNLFF
jgi:hypothetical protein